MTELIIREVRAEDASYMLNVFLPKLGSESDNLSFGKEGLNISIEDEKKFLEKANDGKSVYLAAVMDDKIIGTCQSSPMQRRFSHRSEISIGILKEFWGKGFGSKLLEELIKKAKGKGTEALQMEVLSDNIRAINLYKRYGFENVGHYRNFSLVNGVYHDAEIMELMLDRD